MPNTKWSLAVNDSMTLDATQLIATATTTTSGVRAVDGQITGKLYWECTFASTSGQSMGLASLNSSVNNFWAATQDPLTTFVLTGGAAFIYVGAVTPSGTPSIGNMGTAGDSCACAVDLDTRRIWYRKLPSGNWNGSATADPATGTGGIELGIGGPAYPLFPALGANVIAGRQATANFGDSAFIGTVPSGFTAGWPTGATIPTNVVVTQANAEAWGTGTPALAVTQAHAEAWGTGTPALAVTQALVEAWISVAVAPPPAPSLSKPQVIIFG